MVRSASSVELSSISGCDFPLPFGERILGEGQNGTVKTNQTSLARELRERQTEAERVLWGRLRNRQLEGVKFRRQQPIGDYVVDFASFDKRLIVEIDGGQHNEHGILGRDERRAGWLNREGYRILRFWNNEVLNNVDGVLEVIREALR
jgi:very-short-patch-repair endonuclease